MLSVTELKEKCEELEKQGWGKYTIFCSEKEDEHEIISNISLVITDTDTENVVRKAICIDKLTLP